jgi:hypothetical protein
MMPQMGHSEFRLYLALCRITEKHTAVELHLPSYRITDYTGLHSETIPVARRKLEERGLITSRKGANGRNVYTLLDPERHTNFQHPYMASNTSLASTNTKRKAALPVQCAERARRRLPSHGTNWVAGNP